MDVILGLLMMVFGILSLVRGELKLSADTVATGGTARAAALLLVVSLPLAILTGMARAIVERAAHGPVFGEVFPSLLSYIVLFICAVAAVAIAKRGNRTPAAGA